MADETAHQRREKFLRLAAEAEATAFKILDPKSKHQWLELARGWFAMAKEIPPKDQR